MRECTKCAYVYVYIYIYIYIHIYNIYIYYTCRICAVEVCIYVDQLNYTLSLSFGKAVVFTSEYALHFIDCNLFVKLFIDRAPWIQIRLSLRLQGTANLYGGVYDSSQSLPLTPNTVSSFARCGPT